LRIIPHKQSIFRPSIKTWLPNRNRHTSKAHLLAREQRLLNRNWHTSKAHLLAREQGIKAVGQGLGTQVYPCRDCALGTCQACATGTPQQLLVQQRRHCLHTGRTAGVPGHAWRVQKVTCCQTVKATLSDSKCCQKKQQLACPPYCYPQLSAFEVAESLMRTILLRQAPTLSSLRAGSQQGVCSFAC